MLKKNPIFRGGINAVYGDTHYSMTAAMSLDGDRKCSDRSSSQLQTYHWAEDERTFSFN